MKIPFLQRHRVQFPGKKLLIAFGLVVVFLVFQAWKYPEKSGDQIINILGTFVAAWAGGWAAFSAERMTRDDAERKSRISAANKALFTIATMFNVFENLRQFYIDADNLREDQYRALNMDSPQPGMMQALHFDFDSLNFFLDQEGDVSSMALMELQLLDWRNQLVINTVELRAKATDDLHKAIQTKPVANSTPDVIKTLYSAEYKKLAALTDQLIQEVDAGIDLTKKMDATMQTALQLQFPGQNFLQINFVEKPQTPLAAE